MDRDGSAAGVIARAALQALLWAGPLGLGLAILVLIAAAPFFRHGPGTPSAGDSRAWTAIWAAIALSGLGCAAGSSANAIWLAMTLRAGRVPNGREWIRVAVNLLMGLGCVVFWTRR